ncbi:unnamed protein product [Medioppia subpectinata]|uniref:RRM domain-containing protein n=1 Tax=Medioppia subpectinata TaxID=1979941 RepID=A0A7R9KMF1_9ACAR|nr:unnamed protein product [Medioppia subpectinata]CAG2104981.1 unnamed protein product [Medioppia subpectinata]
MDARQRLNQLRRFKAKTRLGRNGRQVVRDLRQKISNDNRFGGQSGKRSLVSPRLKAYHSQTRPQVSQSGKRVTLVGDQRMPRVSVNLSQLRDNSGISVNTRTTTRTRTEPKQQRQTTVSSTQPIIMPQMVELMPQTSGVGRYSTASSTPVRHNPYLADDSKNTVLELFGEIGPMVRTSRVNSSMVFIVYEDSMSAKNACQTYHNRLLDGLPMSCSILSQSVNEFEVDSQPTFRSTPYRLDNTSELLAAQLRQINEIQPISNRFTAGQTLGTNRRPNRSQFRYN